VPGRIAFDIFSRTSTITGASRLQREKRLHEPWPGSYRFRLVASNSEGQWNGPETTISLNVATAYYQTAWFRLSLVAAFLAVLWALYQLRLRQLAREFNVRLEDE